MSAAMGIHIGLDSGAAVVREGKVIAAISEERIRNQKHYFGFPEYSIGEIMKLSHVTPEEVGLIAFSSYSFSHNPGGDDRGLMMRSYETISPFFHDVHAARFVSRLLGRTRHRRMISFLRRYGLDSVECIYLEHHACHAALGYRLSPFNHDEKVLVLTCDGTGDGISATVNIGQDGEIRRIAETSSYDSLGLLYSAITVHLGMRANDHEYKVMGLAPYGRYDLGVNKEWPLVDKMHSLVRLNPGNGLTFQNTSGAWGEKLQRKLLFLLAKERFDNIAAAAQKHLEEIMVGWVKEALKKTGAKRVATGGGSFLNVKANKVLRENFRDVQFFFDPICDDAGLPVGAALEAYYALCKKKGTKAVKTQLGPLYWGSEWSEEEIAKAIDGEDWRDRAKWVDDIEEASAHLLKDGFVVARFNGRTEFGPRALGNRSIMADPRDYTVTRKINFMIKMRDFWMPFAPSILSERKADYLIGPKEAPYMIEAFDTTERRRDLVAALHPFDSTCRPQTVTEEWNPSYYKTIKVWSELTRVGGILNTSFNLHGYPIVNSPEQALWTMKNSHLDYLAIGNWLVKNKTIH
jgi:carbamoyltransferase